MSTIVKSKTRKSHDADTETLSCEYPKTNSLLIASDAFSIADAPPVTAAIPSVSYTHLTLPTNREV